MSDGATQAELEEWAELAATVNFNVTRSASDGQLAGKAAPLVCSEFIPPGLPTAVHSIFTQAIEAGYARALSDIQDGVLDGEIRGWRPDLAEG